MAPLDRISRSDGSFSPKCLPELHPGQHDEHNDNRHDDNRNDCDRTDGWRLQKLVGDKHYSEWTSWRCINNLFRNDSRVRLSTRNCRTDSRNHRNGGHHTNNRANISHNFAIGLLAVSFLLPAGVKASGDGVTAIANPQAVSTGQATNQAVQINQGGYSKQGYSPGHFCNSPTLTVTPFYLGNDVHPDYMRSQNFGIQATVSVPLDGEMVRLCKDLAAKKLDKERLDYALIRALKCAELMKTGFMFHPSSPFSVVCQDVVPIAREPKTSEASSQLSSEPES